LHVSSMIFTNTFSSK